MTAPLRMSFGVDCSAEHAFAVWTSGIGTWWPTDHTVTGRPGLTVVMQSGVGGRIYERAPDGDEHDWGEVTVWNPPAGTKDDPGGSPRRPGGGVAAARELVILLSARPPGPRPGSRACRRAVAAARGAR